jgi:hypothetical protein
MFTALIRILEASVKWLTIFILDDRALCEQAFSRRQRKRTHCDVDPRVLLHCLAEQSLRQATGSEMLPYKDDESIGMLSPRGHVMHRSVLVFNCVIKAVAANVAFP